MSDREQRSEAAPPTYTTGDRLRDIIDESFGLQPVMSDEDALTFLERKLFEGRRTAEAQTARCFACATDMPEAECLHWAGIGWSCTDRKACRARRVGAMPTGWLGHAEPDDHGAEDLPPVWCSHARPYCSTVGECQMRRRTDEPVSAREAARRRTPLDGADAQALEGALAATERERDARYSRDEHIAALEALEFSTRMTTIEECARWLDESEDLNLVAGRMRKAMRLAK